jgi:hypothetical protein
VASATGSKSTRASLISGIEDTGSRLLLDGYVDSGLDLSGRSILQFSAVGSQLTGAHFDRSYISDASFGGGRSVSTYSECSFNEATINFGSGGFARFVRCTFLGARLTNWYCFAVELVDCTFSGRIEGAFFNGTVPDRERQLIGRDRNDFFGNDFSETKLVDVGFRTGIDLAQQRLPSGPNYLLIRQAAEAIARGKGTIGQWSDPRRARASAFLQALEFEAQGGQRDLFIQLDDYADLDPDLVLELADRSGS